ncbi:hypothetical protein COO60DRAFT_744152 [Scenedesmus sp. NREL 46B-D3]|nr:hypothetical protein COO60DRAFT_744152 [Scenedesmus sp. NREL 46B-D3]
MLRPSPDRQPPLPTKLHMPAYVVCCSCRQAAVQGGGAPPDTRQCGAHQRQQRRLQCPCTVHDAGPARQQHLSCSSQRSDMLFGQVEVTAMVSAASGGFSTSFYLQSSSSSSSSSGSSTGGALPRGSEDRISYNFLTGGNPPVPNSVMLSSTARGAAMGEQLMKPGEYQKRLGLGWNSRVNNTFVDYTISWQSSRVTFAINGIPLVTRKRARM